MEGFVRWARDLSTGSLALRLFLATILGGLIGGERGYHGRAAGMRTHILVCLGAALSSLIGLYATKFSDAPLDPLRVGAQVISGIGFLGAGTILIKDHFKVTGLTTAAGLWATAAVGLATGFGYYEGALMVAALVLVANAVLPHIEQETKLKATGRHIYVELEDIRKTNEFSVLAYTVYEIESLQIVPAHSGIPGHIGVKLDLLPESREKRELVCRKLAKIGYVALAVALRQ